MTKIKIAYRQVIDSRSSGHFEKKVFNDSFNEFRMQSQAYNEGGKLASFADLVKSNPKAVSLHYKVGFSVGRYIAELKNVIPDLHDSIGKSIAFEDHEFQLIESDLSNKQAHKVALIYTSAWLVLYAIAGMHLIVGNPGEDNASVPTFTLQLRENLSVVAWKDVKNQTVAIYETAE